MSKTREDRQKNLLLSAPDPIIHFGHPLGRFAWQVVALIQESLSVAHKTGAIGPKDLERVAVDTTVQPKAVAHPTDARLMHRAITKLVGFAKRNRVPLRQSYLRLAKRAAIMVGRYTHAHQFKRARRQLKFLRTRLGRIIRDIRRVTASIRREMKRRAAVEPVIGHVKAEHRSLSETLRYAAT